MKDEKERVNEPYRPDGTPNPPQEIDPSQRRKDKEQSEPQSPTRSNPEANERKNKEADEKQEPGKKLLGESEIEIDDETTI